jgi:hypothetical protein
VSRDASRVVAVRAIYTTISLVSERLMQAYHTKTLEFQNTTKELSNRVSAKAMPFVIMKFLLQRTDRMLILTMVKYHNFTCIRAYGIVVSKYQ